MTATSKEMKNEGPSQKAAVEWAESHSWEYIRKYANNTHVHTITPWLKTRATRLVCAEKAHIFLLTVCTKDGNQDLPGVPKGDVTTYIEEAEHQEGTAYWYTYFASLNEIQHDLIHYVTLSKENVQ